MTLQQRLTVHSPRGVHHVVVRGDDIERDLADILRRAGLPLNTRCGRHGLCNGCLVEVLHGRLLEGDTETASRGTVRACLVRLRPGSETEIRIPPRSLLAHEPQIVASFRCNVSHAAEPLWQTVAVSALPSPLPTAPTLEVVARALNEQFPKSLPVRISDPPDAPGGCDHPSACILEFAGDHWLLEADGRDERLPAYGIALDVGTTTIVALLVELATGRVAASASDLNSQIALGDNVLTRINLCIQDKQNIHALQEAVTAKSLASLIERLLADSRVAASQIAAVCVAGNTTMLHLLCGVDPSSLGVAPFTPQFLEYRRLTLQDLPGIVSRISHLEPRFSERSIAAGSGLRSATGVHLLPSAAAYVGADITAGVFSSGMFYRRDPCLLVDIGTNGEIVLGYDGQFLGCATAAGPAFEGAGMACGVRAGQGAISHVRFVGDPLRAEIEVIGDGPPIGVCGTGYVDFVAKARTCGLIGRTGRITPKGLESPLLAPLPRGRGFRIATGRGGEALVVSESDIACLLQAKAAIAAGIVCLLNRFGLTSQDIRTVYLAGGFGFHMDRDSLIECGILPGFAASQIEVVGNTSLAGAYLALIDAGSVEEIQRIAAAIEIVELNLEPNFTSCYIDQLFLP